MVDNNTIKPLILFGDGTVSQVLSVPHEEINEEGIVSLVFHLRPSKIQVSKFNLKYSDYDDPKEGILYRAYPKVECLSVGEGYIEKEFIEWYGMLCRLSYALEQFMGDEHFQELKKLTEKIMRKKKLSVGVMKITNNPQSKYHYFCISDVNGNQTAVSKHFAELLMENKRLQKENFRLKGYVERLTYESKQYSTQEDEYIKRQMDKVDLISKPAPQAPTNEELAGKDQNY